MLVGGGVLGFMLLVVVGFAFFIVVLASRNAPGKANNFTPVGGQVGQGPIPPRGGARAAVGGKSENLPTNAVDLLAFLDLNRDVVEGKTKWDFVGQTLHCTEGNFVPRIQPRYRPPEEYDYVVTFSQPRFRNGVALIAPKPGVGGLFGWSVAHSTENTHFLTPTFGLRSKTLFDFQPNKKYTSTLQVRRDKLVGLVNGTPLGEAQPTDKRLGLTVWHKMKDDNHLALSCDDPTVFESLYVIEVTGKGTKEP
jgi:hypothetical protein